MVNYSSTVTRNSGKWMQYSKQTFPFLPKANLCIPQIFKHDSSASNWNTRARMILHSIISFPFDEACMVLRWFDVSRLHDVRGTSPDCLIYAQFRHCVLGHSSAKLHLSSQSPLWNQTKIFYNFYCQREQCGHKWLTLHIDSIKLINAVNHSSLLCIIDKAIRRCIIPHHIHIDSLLANFFLESYHVLPGGEGVRFLG